MMLARVSVLAVLAAQPGAFALPTPRDEPLAATESEISTGCAQELAMAFAALPAVCGVEAAEDYENGGWEARAAACLVGGHEFECSPACAAAVQVLRPAVGVLRGLGAAVVTADDRERRTAPSVVTHRHANSENMTIDGPLAMNVAVAAEASNRRLQKAASLQLVDLGGGAAAFCSPVPLCPQFAAEDAASPGALVLSGCLSDGHLGDPCTLTCEEGYRASAPPTAGTCTLSADGATASYLGQAVTCEPETLPDGSFAAAYCSVEAPEVIDTCCEGTTGACDANSNLPTTCSVECAEAWLPLWEHCESNLGQYNVLTTLCESAAEDFLSAAPSTITISGLRCHPFANGVYTLDERTISAKRAWHTSDGGQDVHLFWSDSPDRWRLGLDTQTAFAEFESYENLPPWQDSTWQEECSGMSADSALLLDPGYTTDDCETALQLVQEEVHTRCCTDGGECIDGTPPSRCEYDCAHIWWEYSQDCQDYLNSAFPGTFTDFTAQCDRTHARMLVKSERGTVDFGGPAWTTTFAAERDVEYKVEMVPMDTDVLRRSEVQVIAPHTHHVMASRFDSSTQATGRKVLQWAATQDEAGVEISVEALDGHGDFQLEVTIVGTIEHLAPEAITIPPSTTADVSVAIECQWDDDCTYRYHGEELRGSGSRFELRLHAVAGLTYSFSTELMTGMSSAGTHFSVGIYHENALGGSESAEAIQGNDFALGQWTVTPPGAQTYAQYYQCTPSEDDPDRLTHVPCGGDEQLCRGDLRCQDVGDFRTHPSGTFDSSHSFDWPCAATGTYFIEFTANCDVPFYSDVSRCNQVDGEWECPNAADSQCSSETRLTIDVIDESTTISQQTTLPVDPGMLIPGSKAQAQLAGMFALSQHPAIAYITEILPVGRGDCSMPHCQNGGDCVDMPLSTVDGVPNSPTYRCDCTPSWVGLDCTETVEEQAQLGALFDVNGRAKPTVPIGGGHRRTQGAEPEPEPEPPLAAITTHCRGQTPGLARDHCKNVHDRIDLMGPGGTTSNGIDYDNVFGSGITGDKGENPLNLLTRIQLVDCVRRQLTVFDCAQGAHRRLQTEPSVSESKQNPARRRAQGLKGSSSSPSLPGLALYNEDSEGQLCLPNQCEPNPCENGGICTPSDALVTGAGVAAGFMCTCVDGRIGLICSQYSELTFPGGQIMTATMDAQLQAWLVERGLANADGWALCYSSPNGDPKDDPSEWHSRCDGHVRTVVVGRNSLGYTFGGYTPTAWDAPGSNPDGSGWNSDGSGHFLFRLEGPGLIAEQYGTTGSCVATGSCDYQLTSATNWPVFGGGNSALMFGNANGGSLGGNAYCDISGGLFDRAPEDISLRGHLSPNELCGGGDGTWGETEMEMWYAVPPPLPDPNTDAFLQAQPEIAAHRWVKCFDSDVDDTSTPAVFHANCDAFDETVSVGRNGKGKVFGGFAEVSWSYDACCAGNDGAPSDWVCPIGDSYCADPTASGNFLFGISPGDPVRFGATGTGHYQYIGSSWWPSWGSGNDLSFGYGNEALGVGGQCNEARYMAASDQICGGNSDWGKTQLEVWYRVPPPCPSCFAGSQLITAEQATTINGWIADGDPRQVWSRCFSSFEDDSSSPGVFHQQCDSYDVTVTVARNSLGYTFGGYAAVSWAGTGYVHEAGAAANFIFGLSPAPARFASTGATTACGCDGAYYQFGHPDYWPHWGGIDLLLGERGPPGNADARCSLGCTDCSGGCTTNSGGGCSTYSGTPDQICGGTRNWGQTDLEVWRLAWLDSWDSGAVTNANGKTFSLYLLPPQPPNTFVDHEGAGVQVYVDLCEAVGLRTITSGYDWGSPISTHCPGYNCMPLVVDNGDIPATWVFQTVGWDITVTHDDKNSQVYNHRGGSAGWSRNSGWDASLSPVCGAEHCAEDCGAHQRCSADGVCACDDGWYGATCDSDTPTFPGGQLLTTAMDAQLQAWLVERGLANADGWTLCYSSPNGDPKDDPSEWHSRCDGHVRTVVVGRNSLGYTFGGYSGSAWDDPVDGWIGEDTGQFIFRLDGPGLAAEAFDYTTGSFQWNNINAWPNFGNGADLSLGQAQAGHDGTLGAAWQAYCNQGTSYQGSPNEVCGGGVGNGVTYGPGSWGETEMEMWYAVLH